MTSGFTASAKRGVIRTGVIKRGAIKFTGPVRIALPLSIGAVSIALPVSIGVVSIALPVSISLALSIAAGRELIIQLESEIMAG